MNAPKRVPGAALSVVTPPPTRTPERQALAEAIERRDYVATLVRERQAFAEQVGRSSYPLYDRLRELEERERDLPMNERDRLDMLLSRRDPDMRSEREKIAEERIDVQKKIEEIRSQSQRADADVRLLEEDHRSRIREVHECVTNVVVSDPALPAVVAETERLLKRVAILRRACGSALNERRIGQPEPRHARFASLIVQAEGPCPWDAVKARLVDDPDAVCPMPEDV